MRVHHPPLLPPPILLSSLRTEQLRRTHRRRVKPSDDMELDGIDDPATTLVATPAPAAKPTPPPRPTTTAARLADQTLGALLLGQEQIQPAASPATPLPGRDPSGTDPGSETSEPPV